MARNEKAPAQEAEIALPPIRNGHWLAVTIERQPIAGRDLWAVTTRAKAGQLARRRWFADEGLAIAHAAETSDTFTLPLIDMREPSDRDSLT